MSLKLLHKGTESERRWKIIDVSKAKDCRYLPQLHARLSVDETYDNKRHIVRALGNIGSPESAPVLMELLNSERGLILGDICQSLGKLGVQEAKLELEKLILHKEEWVNQEAKSAIRKLAENA